MRRNPTKQVTISKSPSTFLIYIKFVDCQIFDSKNAIFSVGKKGVGKIPFAREISNFPAFALGIDFLAFITIFVLFPPFESLPLLVRLLKRFWRVVYRSNDKVGNCRGGD